MDNNVTYFTFGALPESSLHQILPQAFPSNVTRFYCPVHGCTESAVQPQVLGQHMLTSHLPCHIHCPTCYWRGDRIEDLNQHLKVAKCGPRPTREQYLIYETKLILDWILNDGVPIETVVRYALSFVYEKAYELGKGEEWREPWGREGKRARHRYDHLRR